jgi:hypothetical protein
MKKTPNYLEDRLCLNVLANSVENAKACYEAAQGHVVLGVLSKNYATDEAAIEDMKRYIVATDNALSVGLGAGILTSLPWSHVYQKFCNLSTLIKSLLVLVQVVRFWDKMIPLLTALCHQQELLGWLI